MSSLISERIHANMKSSDIAEDRRNESGYQFHLPRNLANQRVSTSGPAGGGGRGTDGEGTADDCALACGGLGGGIGAAGWDGEAGVDDIFCLMSSSTACSAAMFWAI